MACHSLAPRPGGIAATAADWPDWFATAKTALALGLLRPWLDLAFADQHERTVALAASPTPISSRRRFDPAG